VIAVMNFMNGNGAVVIEAGALVPDEIADALSQHALASNDAEAYDKFKGIAYKRLDDIETTSDPLEYHVLMADYFRSLALAHESKWRMLKEQQESER